MRKEFSKVFPTSHASLFLTNYKQHIDDSLNSLIFRWCELLLQSFGTNAEPCRTCRNKLKIDLFSSWLFNEKIARGVIRKHPKPVQHTFQIEKEKKKDD